MTPTINASLISQLGIKLDATHQGAFLKHLENTLEERVGLAIFDLIDDAEAAELVHLTERGNDAEVAEWLSVHVPDYQQVIQDEYDILMGEVAEHADFV